MNIEYFDKIYCICMADRPRKQEYLLSQLTNFYPELTPKIFQAINTRHLKNHHIGCALSHRAVIQEAKDRGYKSILVFEEDARLHKNFRNLFDQNINELHQVDWDVLYLGACVWNPKPPKPPREFGAAPQCKHLNILKGSTCTHGLAYHSRIYDYILQELPNESNAMGQWCKEWAAIDQWLMYRIQGQGADRNGYRKTTALISSPRLCSQPFLIGKNKQDHPDDFPQ
jgi:GR25 family glycosyltransferase involved in LPS biosynthesis